MRTSHCLPVGVLFIKQTPWGFLEQVRRTCTRRTSGVYYSSRTTKSDDSVTQKCWSNIDTQKDACFRPSFAMQPIIRDRPKFARNVIKFSSLLGWRRGGGGLTFQVGQILFMEFFFNSSVYRPISQSNQNSIPSKNRSCFSGGKTRFGAFISRWEKLGLHFSAKSYQATYWLVMMFGQSKSSIGMFQNARTKEEKRLESDGKRKNPPPKNLTSVLQIVIYSVQGY